jgi:hypothetical protein
MLFEFDPVIALIAAHPPFNLSGVTACSAQRNAFFQYLQEHHFMKGDRMVRYISQQEIYVNSIELN